MIQTASVSSVQPVLAPAAAARVEAIMTQRPLSFEANKGQFDAQVKFLARGPRQSVFLAADGMHLVLDNPTTEESEPTQTVVRIQFDGGSEKAEFAGLDRLQAITNYFRLGAQITNVPNYLKVRQLDVYPGIDVIYYGNQGRLEYDFMVFPGADVAAIKLKLSGHEQAAISAAGELVLLTPAGDVTLHKPIGYQEKDGVRVDVPIKYVLARNHVQFEAADFDRTRALIIDPILSYSTYVTGSSSDGAGAITVDSSGNAYITGWTSSTNFPLAGAYQTSKKGTSDAFISKLNASGGGLIYSTYLGGKQGSTAGTGIAIDATGNAYVTGTTTSSSFPVTSGAYQTTIGANSGFVTKLNAQGNALVYSTFVRGGQSAALAVDANGNAYLAGTAFSAFTTTAGVFQPALNGTQDAFIAKLNATGTAMVYASFLGGSGSESGHGVAIDAAGSAYVTGRTPSADFPLVNPYQASLNGGYDGFVTKVDPTGAALVYSTYLGGALNDYAYAIAVDAQGNAHVVGTTYSLNFPVLRAFQSFKAFTGSGHQSVNNAFITKLNAAGDGLVYSSYLGGQGCLGPGIFSCWPNGDEDSALAIALDAAGNAYLAGSARSLTFRQADPIQSTLSPYGSSTPFVAKVQDLANTNATLAFSAVLGKRDPTFYDMAAKGVAVDSAGSAYALGEIVNYALPWVITPGAFQSTAVQISNVTRTVVFKVSPGRFTTSLSPSSFTPTSADSITLTATVGSAVPGGTVTFASAGNTIGTAAMAQGQASITTALPAGVHQLTATYSGDNKSSPPLFLPVKQALVCN